ncbi:hydrolase [Gordoniibacillus kamchatkensis]|uniref:Hydrolase n=1 Tax=Gordoniibacillus kamchatkensis TaxID=1590651 RepID=A0ABR5APX5_9BACL|nr:metal-dependent hydrolase [Paenibacillus sp. VKM B-2647]KIL42417.1 hydrolase [Paenibacillus sp. VKM B-2647]
MDTGTHLVIGLGLAGLAHVDPYVAHDPSLAAAVLIGTVIGSQIPDADSIVRLKGNAAYIRHHRGLSHGLPALVLWTLLITMALGLIFPGASVGHIALWTGIAAAFHVFTDLFNTYGTQALRPFSERWVGWNIIHIFDPFLFFSHLVAILMWSLHLARPEVLFPLLYAIVAVYYVWRTIDHAVLERGLKHKDREYREGDRYTLIPTVHFSNWNVVKRHQDGTYALGELRSGELRWVDEVACANHPAVEASKSNPDAAALLYYSSYACAEVREHKWGYEVRWADVRYRHRKQYPFVAVVHLDKELNELDSYVGWVSESKLGKKLRVDLY